MLGKVRLALIEIAGDEFDRQQSTPAKLHEHRQQAVGILAARQADEPATLAPEHGEILEGLPRLADQLLPQPVEAAGLRRMAEKRLHGRIAGKGEALVFGRVVGVRHRHVIGAFGCRFRQ